MGTVDFSHSLQHRKIILPVSWSSIKETDTTYFHCSLRHRRLVLPVPQPFGKDIDIEDQCIPQRCHHLAQQFHRQHAMLKWSFERHCVALDSANERWRGYCTYSKSTCHCAQTSGTICANNTTTNSQWKNETFKGSSESSSTWIANRYQRETRWWLLKFVVPGTHDTLYLILLIWAMRTKLIKFSISHSGPRLMNIPQILMWLRQIRGLSLNMPSLHLPLRQILDPKRDEIFLIVNLQEQPPHPYQNQGNPSQQSRWFNRILLGGL